MNAVEIEEAVSGLAELPFDAAEFPFAFLEAFGNKATTIKRLRSGTSNKSDVGGVLQTNNIHLKVAEDGAVAEALAGLKASPATTKARTKFILATDGKDFQAEDLNSGEVLICEFADFPARFDFFLPLAGITYTKELKETKLDRSAARQLNRLYVELLKDNPDWGTADRRHDMNHFMARLIFCFFAEDTDIFTETDQFTATIERMSEKDSSNTHEIISELFRSMNTKVAEREKEGIARWANSFPYVNGGLFSESVDVPRFSKIARSYLLHIGNLDWKKINPDIFGSMIQAVADDEERGALGMHYTSVPNILKVLNPLFLDDLREKLEEAEDNARKLLNLRNRMAKIRVFDPACGSGNFLVIAYKEMRALEAEINERRNESDRRSEIPLTNFRGIELRNFPAEIARLALIIAEYQCDVLYRGQREALRDFLPLDAMNWITCCNALRLDWLSICPPTGTVVRHRADDLFSTPLEQAQIDFENEGGETYVCGNPPYIGDKKQNAEQKADINDLFSGETKRWRSLDYISGFFLKASDLVSKTAGQASFVSTNSICQGQQLKVLWPIILRSCEITAAHTAFKWANLAANNAGVTVIIVQIASNSANHRKRLFEGVVERSVDHISPYLTSSKSPLVGNLTSPISDLPSMTNGCAAKDGGNLICDSRSELPVGDAVAMSVVRKFWGSDEIIKGLPRYCFWIEDGNEEIVWESDELSSRVSKVREMRLKSTKVATQSWADRAHRFVEIRRPPSSLVLALPSVATESRPYLTPALLSGDDVVSNLAFAIFDAPIWSFSILSSSLHLTWVATVCGQLETRIRYSNTLGWNTFPVPKLTEKNKSDLTRSAEDILLAREAHFPATIADLYDPDKMPDDLRAAHDRNDEVLERIYIGRRFKNDTERLEKLFELYTKMAAANDLKKTNTRMKA